MSEMVERVAKAILRTPRTNQEWEVGAKEWYFAMARAAIEAMAEPTREMVAAGELYRDVSKSQAEIVWERMVEAALK